jgi:hypothetical protein
MDTQRWIFVHCRGGWRAVFCVLDNLVPHEWFYPTDDPDDRYAEGKRGFRWVCRMHDWAST